MSYLRFDKTLMTNLEETLPREVLRTNRSGAYHSTTIVDCNTRKYHGLLVVPVPEFDDERVVLLSSLDETVIQHGAEFNLGLHKYQGNNFSPAGHKYIRDYDCDIVPTTTYRVGGVILKKEKVFVHHENRILIRYTLLDAHSDTIIRFRPFLAFRSVRQFTHENDNVDKNYQEVENGISTCMYPGMPTLFMQFNNKCEFKFMPDWYRGIEYPKEQERGYDSKEDLYVPGYFELKIKKGESIVFSGGTTAADTKGLTELFQHEVNNRIPRDNFENCLINAAHQFLSVRDGESYILAGYPWFLCRARDMFVSLPGLTLANNEVDKFERVMSTALKGIDEFLEGKELTVRIQEMDKPDVLLWFFWTVQQYAKFVSKEKAVELYGDTLNRVIDFIISGRHPNLLVHDNALVYSYGRDRAISWMNSTVNGRPVVPRSGYLVEFNALWYNALCMSSRMAEEAGNAARAAEFNGLAEKCAESFKEVFLNDYGYLLDYVDGAMCDWSVRPNMIFAVALDNSPLSFEQRKGVLDICTKELNTPKGLRSLSPKSVGYNPMYVGPQTQRDYAYHQGTAWPWLGGFYMEAYLKVRKRSGISFVERTMIGYESEMTSHCIGSIPELFDGNPPFRGRGAISFAMNVAEILRVQKIVDKYNNL